MYLHTCINSSFGHCIFAAKTYCNPIMERLDEILEIVREIREDVSFMKRHRNMLCGMPILEVDEVCDLLKMSDKRTSFNVALKQSFGREKSCALKTLCFSSLSTLFTSLFR